MADLRRRIGDFEGAESQARKVTSLYPESARAWYRLGGMLGRAEARAACLKATELDPKFVEAARRLGEGFAESVDWLAGAREWSDRALALDPDSFRMRSRLLAS